MALPAHREQAVQTSELIQQVEKTTKNVDTLAKSFSELNLQMRILELQHDAMMP